MMPFWFEQFLLWFQNRHKSLPRFIIIGAMKSGTTSLFHYLSQHPQIIPANKKEVHYFDGGRNPQIDTYKKGQYWYRSHFPRVKELGGDKITGEASPLYLLNPLVPKRIAQILPEIKLIVILRNPTERAISHYFHALGRKEETLPIMEAFQIEEERLEPIFRNQDFKNTVFYRNSYKTRGKYKEQLERYLQYFQREQLLILNSNDLFNDINKTLQIIFEFINIQKDFKINDATLKNVSMNKASVPSDVYEYLDSFFLPHNEELFHLIGKRFDW